MVSVIVPVYNAASTVESCLSSIAAQTLDDWECVVVDDGSGDASVEICDRFASEDRRFKVVHQPNKGVSSARNKALDLSSGDFVVFVDSDDSLIPYSLERLVAAMGKADLVVSGMRKRYPDGRKEDIAPSSTCVFRICPENTDKLLDLERKFLLYPPHEKMYRREIIGRLGLLFDENCSYGEDLMFNFAYLRDVEMISCLDEPLYNYQVTPSGLTAAERPDRFSQDYSQWKLVRSFYERKGLLSPSVDEYHFKRLWGIVYDGLFAYPSQKEKRGYIEKVLNIPEMDSLGKFQDVFNCSDWIKKAILRGNKFFFKAFFKFYR